MIELLFALLQTVPATAEHPPQPVDKPTATAHVIKEDPAPVPVPIPAPKTYVLTSPPPPPPVSIYPSTPRPKGSPYSWVYPEDYPQVSLLLEEEGASSFRLTVDAEGRVSACMITGSSGFSRLDELTCKLVSRRARFTPAQDRAGNVVASTYSQRVVWLITDDSPMDARLLGWSRPAEAKKLKQRGIVGFEATVGEDGKISSCQVPQTSGAEALDQETCRRLREVRDLSVKRDRDGKPVARNITGRIKW